jgi:hypothetical protein
MEGVSMRDKPPDRLYMLRADVGIKVTIFMVTSRKFEGMDIEYISAELLEPLKKVWQCFRHVYNENQYNFNTNPYTEALGIMWKSLDSLAKQLGWDKEDADEKDN